MFKANLKIIAELKRFITTVACDRSLLNRFCVSEKGFTRNRKLPFPSLVLLITKLCKKTLSVELDRFFEEMGGHTDCSVSAFTQQRLKLRPLFFHLWNVVLQASFYLYYGNLAKRWKGYRVVAADGSNVSLVNNAALNKCFGGQRNQNGEFVLAKTFYHYDVLNELVLLPQIKPYRYGELNMHTMPLRKRRMAC